MATQSSHLKAAFPAPRTAASVLPAADVRFLTDKRQSENAVFFLASVDNRYWKPRVVTVAEGDNKIGIVCTKERKIAGIPTGIIYADSTLDSMVIATPERREQVLEAALRYLMTSVRGIRLSVTPGGFEDAVVQKIIDSSELDARSVEVKNHHVLKLPGDHEEFLSGLGRKTRKNFGYYRRKCEAAGCLYVRNLPFSAFIGAARQLVSKSVVGGGAAAFVRGMKMLRAAKRPFLAGLRDKRGEWLSVFGGWYERDRVVMFTQLNDDQDHADSSLSVVMRSYVIQTLIEQGVGNLVFWAGTGAPLHRYCEFLPAKAVYLDAPTATWRAMRRVLKSSGAFLPAGVSKFMRWVLPPEG